MSDFAGLALSRAPGVATVEIGVDVILVDDVRGTLTPLNPSAALLWACLDGTSRLDEICVDVADLLAVPLEQVSADVELMARQFLDEGLASAPGFEPRRPVAEPSNDCGCGAHEEDHSSTDRGDDPRWLHEPPNT